MNSNSKPTVFLLFITTLFVVIVWNYTSANNIHELVKDLESKDSQNRLLAIEELGRMKDKEAIEILLKLVFTKTEDWRIKILAIRLLGEVDDPQISDKLVTIFDNPFLNEECSAIKWNTAIALGKEFNRGTRAVDSLIEALSQKNLLIKEAAIQSLGKIGDPKAGPYLVSALDDSSFAIKFSAIRALENIGDPQPIPLLQKIAVTYDDPLIKQIAQSVIKTLSKEQGDNFNGNIN